MGKLVAWSIPALRIAVGAVFLGFGLLKFFPNVSPAQEIAETTFEKLSFGLIPGATAIYGIAAPRDDDRSMPVAQSLDAARHVAAAVRAGRHPLAARAAHRTALLRALPRADARGSVRDQGRDSGRRGDGDRGGLLPAWADDPRGPGAGASGHPSRGLQRPPQARDRSLGSGSAVPVEEVCDLHGISEVDYYEWRDTALDAASRALDAVPLPGPERPRAGAGSTG